ncbi:recombinase family protein [Streptomyces malaysiensis]
MGDQLLRGLRAIRLSVLTDSSTSVQRQRESTDREATAMGISFGEGDALREAVDLDVSALKTSPFERPELGPWLARPDEYDVIVWWRFDRAIASMADMHDLAEWAKKHRKMLLFAEGVGNAGRLVCDFRNPMDPMAELMLVMFAFASQVERMSTRERVTGAHAALRHMDLRWKGGRPPYGYRPKRLATGGYTLEPDPGAMAVIQRILKAMIGGPGDVAKTASAVAMELAADGVPTPWEYWKAATAVQDDSKDPEDQPDPAEAPEDVTETPGRRMWSYQSIRNILTSPAMLGWKTYQGAIIRKPDGAPVMFTESPILQRAEYDRIKAVFEARSTGPRERSDTRAELLGVIFCSGCDRKMYLDTGDYECSPRTPDGKCPAPVAIKQEWAEGYVAEEFLSRVGPLRVVEKIEVPGYDPQPEIKETEAEYKAHLEERGKQKSRAALAAWQERADALDARLADLESREKVEPSVVISETSTTYRDQWNAADDPLSRRKMLMDAGVKLVVRKGTRGGWRSLDKSRVSMTIDGPLNEAIEELAALRSSLADE